MQTFVALVLLSWTGMLHSGVDSQFTPGSNMSTPVRPVNSSYSGNSSSGSNMTTPVPPVNNSDTGAGTQFALRLAGSNNPLEGRLEIFYNSVWGTICDDYFNDIAASIACFVLGYGNGGRFIFNSYGPGPGPICMDDVNCNGNERHIKDCPHLPYGSNNCVHSEDVSISCTAIGNTSTPSGNNSSGSNMSTTVRPANSTYPGNNSSGSNMSTTVPPVNSTYSGNNTQFAMRLVGSNNTAEGRLEIFYSDVWGTVCDDSFNDIAARIVCAFLGYGNVGSVLDLYNNYGSGEGQIWLDDVNCNGNEQHIKDCPHLPWGSHNCVHSEDVSISCTANGNSSTPSGNVTTTSPRSTSAQGYNPLYCDGIRLVNQNSASPNPSEGRLEVLYNGMWGTVCDDGFSDFGAYIVCRRLGYGSGTFINNMYGAGYGDIWLDNVLCNGNEIDIASCNHNPWGVHDCGHYEDVSIRCTTNFNETAVNASTIVPMNSTTFRGNGSTTVAPNSTAYRVNATTIAPINSTTYRGMNSSSVNATTAKIVNGSTTLPFNSTGYQATNSSSVNGTTTRAMTTANTTVNGSTIVPLNSTGSPVNASTIAPMNSTTYRGVNSSSVNATTTMATTTGTTSPVVFAQYALRLVNPGAPLNPISGRLEIYYDGMWGTVCRDFFTTSAAQVVCSYLGLGRIGRVVTNTYGYGAGQIWLDDVKCFGPEYNIAYCPHLGWGVSNCGHSEDVAISCS